MAELAAENERLSNLVAQASRSQSLPEDQMRELLRLRAEVAALRQQGKAPGSRSETARSSFHRGPRVCGAADRCQRRNGLRNFLGLCWVRQPDAAVQSCLWAASRARENVLAQRHGRRSEDGQNAWPANPESEDLISRVTAQCSVQVVRGSTARCKMKIPLVLDDCQTRRRPAPYQEGADEEEWR